MYSDFFDVSEQAYYELYCMGSTNPELKRFFRVKISIEKEVHFLQICEIEKSQLTRLIKNSTPFRLEIRSAKNRQEPIQTVMPGESIHYAQCYPKSSESLVLVTLIKGKGQSCGTNIDLMLVKPEPITYDIGEEKLLLRSTVTFFGSNTVLDLVTVNKEDIKSRTPSLDSFKNMVQFTISAISVSFMRLPQGKRRQELLNLVLTNVSGFLQYTGSEFTFDGAIEDIQIDNNSTEKTNFPVLLRKTEFPGDGVKKYFCTWHSVFENPFKSSHVYVSKLQVKFAKVELFVEEEYIDNLLSYKDTLMKSINIHQLGVKECIKFKYYTDFLQLPPEFDISKMYWELAEVAPNNNFIFMESIYVSPIEVELSYYQDAKSTVDKDFELFSLLGVIIGGFEETNFKFSMINQE